MRQTTKLGQLRSLARKHRMQVGDALKDELQAVEDLNAYHPVADWIRSRPWDGVDRFEALWATFELKAEALADVDLYRHVLWAWLVAGAKYAMLDPFERVGIKAFGVLVLQGTQGCGKTQWIKALAPEAETWVGTGLTLDPHSKDDVAKVTRYWITELGEIDSTVRKADVGALKGFLSDQADVYRRPYKEVTESFVRRTLFAASVNPQHFLRDNTGNRRFWVVPVERMRVFDEDGIRAIDLQQLWAQFAHLAAQGAAHHLPPDIEARQMALAERHRTIDPIEDEVRSKVVVDLTVPERLWMTTDEIYRELYPDRELEKWTQADKRAVGVVLSAIGARNRKDRRGRSWSVKRVV
jgi:putative DNA primase/helicase